MESKMEYKEKSGSIARIVDDLIFYAFFKQSRDYRQIGRFIQNLSLEERILLQKATSKDFFHRFS